MKWGRWTFKKNWASSLSIKIIIFFVLWLSRPWRSVTKRHYLFSYCNIAMLIVIVLFSRGRIRVKRLLDLRGLNRLANWKRTKKALRKYKFICLYLKAPRDLCSGILYQSNEHIPFWSQHFQAILILYYARRLVMAFHLWPACSKLASYRYVWDCPRGVTAPHSPGVLVW